MGKRNSKIKRPESVPPPQNYNHTSSVVSVFPDLTVNHNFNSVSTPSTIPPELPRKPSIINTNKIVVALYDYDARQNDDLSFKKGDTMEIIGDFTGDWLLAAHCRTKKKGYIPKNYISEDINKTESQGWWFTGDRREGEKYLMLPGNPRGTFLIRHAADKSAYAMSIRDLNETTNDVNIRHYKIKMTSDSRVYITENSIFKDLLELVAFYKAGTNGLCCRLTKECPKSPETIPFREMEVERSKIKLLDRLGHGQFGEVWRGTLNKLDVAVKTLKTGTMTRDEFLKEAKIMHKLRHPKLVLLMGVCTTTEPIYIITELMVHGSLLDYLKKDDGRKLKIGDLIDIVAQIADGMAYLEKEKYTHRDVRAANMLVGVNMVIKVADFGLAREFDAGIYLASDQTKFPIKWTSPEAAHSHKFGVKSDVWSFGILLYEIFTFGKIPYPAMDNQTTLTKVTEGYRMPRPVNNGFNQRFDCPQPVYDVQFKCWDRIPDKRPSFDYLKNFFENYNTESERQYVE